MLEVSSTLSNLYIDFFPSIKTPFKKSKPAHLVGVQNDTKGFDLSLCLCISTENDLFEIDRSRLFFPENSPQIKNSRRIENTAWSGFREHPPCRHPRSLNPDWTLNTCQLFVNFDQFSMELSSQSGFRDRQS